MRLAKQMEQQMVIVKIRAEFNPLQCIASSTDPLQERKDKLTHAKSLNSHRQHNFDAIWTFEIVGRKFE